MLGNRPPVTLHGEESTLISEEGVSGRRNVESF